MRQGIQLILNPLKVTISALVYSVLTDDAPGLLCLFGGDSLRVKRLEFLAVEDLEVLPLLQWGQTGW